MTLEITGQDFLACVGSGGHGRCLRDGLAVPAVARDHLVQAARRRMLESTEDEVPVAADLEGMFVPWPGALDHRTRKEDRHDEHVKGPHHGGLHDVSLELGCDDGLRRERLVAHQRGPIGHGGPGVGNQREEPPRAPRLDDVVGINEAQEAAARRSDAGVARSVWPSVGGSDHANPTVVDVREQRLYPLVRTVVDDNQLELTGALVKGARHRLAKPVRARPPRRHDEAHVRRHASSSETVTGGRPRSISSGTSRATAAAVAARVSVPRLPGAMPSWRQTMSPGCTAARTLSTISSGESALQSAGSTERRTTSSARPPLAARATLCGAPQ